ncbi:MAG: hypothetical protein JO264_16060, partial [Acidisphaera sp.]|nr:hypothetical protein [Acidisphaera sp.]
MSSTIEIRSIAATVRPRMGLGLLSIAAGRGGAAALGEAVQARCGLALPGPGRWVGGDDLALLWSAPDQFLAVGGTAGLTALPGARLIDLSGSRIVLRVSGPWAREVLSRGVPLDLHPRAMQPGQVAATVVAHIGVQLWQIDETPTYDLAAPVSYAGSLRRWLESAGGNFLT